VLTGRPLYDTAPDHGYFIPPPEWEPLRRAVARGNNILIHGIRGIGKTSLLRQLQLDLRDRGRQAAFVDATAVTAPVELALRIRDAMKGRPGTFQGMGLAVQATGVLPDSAPPPGGASRQLYDTLTSLGDVEPTTVLVDASFSSPAVYGVFGRMRDTLWQLPHQWLVSVDERDRVDALKPPADAFFDSDIALTSRTPDDLVAIVKARTNELPAATVTQIAADARGNPRSAIRDANEALVIGPRAAGDGAERNGLLERASRLGRPHAMLMGELLDLGQASPSDKTLLNRMGLTRARVNTLLQELLDANLAVAATERSDGPGRPRMIYRPALRGPHD
jgi:hypothetical protein